jgi:hypothetical protein
MVSRFKNTRAFATKVADEGYSTNNSSFDSPNLDKDEVRDIQKHNLESTSQKDDLVEE